MMFVCQFSWSNLQSKPQETVDNNLGPGCLTGPKALDPNYCRLPTLLLHGLPLIVLTVNVAPVLAKTFPLLILLMCSSVVVAVSTPFNLFSYYTVWAGNRTHHLPAMTKCTMCYATVEKIYQKQNSEISTNFKEAEKKNW